MRNTLKAIKITKFNVETDVEISNENTIVFVFVCEKTRSLKNIRMNRNKNVCRLTFRVQLVNNLSSRGESSPHSH